MSEKKCAFKQGAGTKTCSEACKYFTTCSRNPYKKDKEATKSINERTCPLCGTTFIKNPRKPNQKYCSIDCSRVANDKYKSEYQELHSAEQNEKARMKRRKKEPEKSNMQKITEIDALAKAAGLTYGQYVALHGL